MASRGAFVQPRADEETRAQLRGSWNGGRPPTSTSLAGPSGRGGAGRWLRVGLQPHSGSCYLRSRVCSAGETQHQAVSCDRVSLSARNVSLRPRPKGLHTLAASPRPSAVGGSRFISVLDLGAQTSTRNPVICPHPAGGNFTLAIE